LRKVEQEPWRLERREKGRAEKKSEHGEWKNKGNESRVKRAQMRVNRREGYQTMEERCLKKGNE